MTQLDRGKWHATQQKKNVQHLPVANLTITTAHMKSWHILSECSAIHSSWAAPCAYRLALPVLYCVTLCTVCFLQFLSLQKARLVFGTFTCAHAQRPQFSRCSPGGTV